MAMVTDLRWKALLVIDRETGERTRIPLADAKVDVLIECAAQLNRLSEETVREVLECGCDVVTPRFIRRYAE